LGDIEVVYLNKICYEPGKWFAQICFLIIFELIDHVFQRVFVEACGPSEIKLRIVLSALAAFRVLNVFKMT